MVSKNLQPSEHFCFTVWRNNLFDFILKIEFELVLNQSEISNSNNDDKASLEGDYCSMILGVLQISSTTRNLVPRFKRWSKGERLRKDGAQHKIGT